MSKTRRQDTSSNRTDRDTVQKLKAAVRSLRKQVNQLRRELNRREDLTDDYKDLLEEETVLETSPQKPPSCPQCSHDIQYFTFEKFSICRCTNKFCTWRKRVEIKSVK